MTKSFALGRNYIHLADGGASAQVLVGPDFWQRIGERRELHEGRLLTFFHLGPGNVHWERHPAGDEILILLSGATALLVEEDGKQRRVRLKAGEAFIVPRGLWHAFDVSEPGDLLAITPGEGTEMRTD
ncbi:MAG TPA: cupin domain-containing protein [Stellaceae bacterium]|nr:cupin domain-containing protein [Stellaceae bacterium]